MRDAPRIAIVGAGPAGIRAAEALVAAGLHPIVIDEGARAGGQIYRRPPEGFTRTPADLYGPEAERASALHALFDRMAAERRLTHHASTSVVALRDSRLHLLGPEGADTIAYDRLILATGASDRVVPIPGWQNAGVYTLGAAQIALKAQGVALGRRMVLVGSGPLLTLVGAQLLKVGAGVQAVLDTATWREQASGLGGLLARPGLALRGLALRATLGTRYRAGITPEQIETDESGPVAFHWRIPSVGSSARPATRSRWAGTSRPRRISPRWPVALSIFPRVGTNGCRAWMQWPGRRGALSRRRWHAPSRGRCGGSDGAAGCGSLPSGSRPPNAGHRAGSRGTRAPRTLRGRPRASLSLAIGNAQHPRG